MPSHKMYFKNRKQFSKTQLCNKTTDGELRGKNKAVST